MNALKWFFDISNIEILLCSFVNSSLKFKAALIFRLLHQRRGRERRQQQAQTISLKESLCCQKSHFSWDRRYPDDIQYFLMLPVIV